MGEDDVKYRCVSYNFVIYGVGCLLKKNRGWKCLPHASSHFIARKRVIENSHF